MDVTTSPLLIASSAPSGYFVAGLAIFGVILLMRTTRRRAMKSKSVKSVPVSERYAELSRENTAGRALGNVMAEMDELSRQIHGRLDTKITKLEIVIRDADERIERLSRLQRDQPTAANSLDVTLESESPLEFMATDSTSDLPALDTGDPSPVDDAHAVIHALADRGMTPQQIASDVARPVGEVELILSLHRTSGSSSRV